MGDLQGLARAIFAGCAANVGPLIGLELGAGDIAVESSDSPPEGAFAVLPLGVQLEGRELARIELAVLLEDLAPLARRMQGNEDPDAKRELGPEDLDGIGEILNLMGGAVDQAVREHLGASLRAQAQKWWRSDEPGDAAFAPGTRQVALGTLVVPGAPPIALVVRMPTDLQERSTAAEAQRASGRVVLLGIEPETAALLERALTAAGVEVQQVQPDAADLAEQWPRTGAVIVSGESEGFALARRLRSANETWELPVLLCASSPTRDVVLRAMASGASHVLALPASDTEMVRVLALAQVRPR
jgi:CheY-like chemotaxis protein